MIAIAAATLHSAGVPQPYLSLEAELHDAFWEAEDDACETPLMADFLRQYPGTALEIGCGSGRLMQPLIHQGFAIEGLELSPDMIARAKANTATVVHCGDMTTWQPARPYAALMAPAFTLQLAADPLSTLNHWQSWLAPGGGLYLTTFIPYAELLDEIPEGQWYPDRELTLPDGCRASLETRHQIDRESRTLHRQHRYTLHSNPPRKHASTQTLRWGDHAEMLGWLDAAGFETTRTILDLDPEIRYHAPDHRHFNGVLTFFARKKP